MTFLTGFHYLPLKMMRSYGYIEIVL